MVSSRTAVRVSVAVIALTVCCGVIAAQRYFVEPVDAAAAAHAGGSGGSAAKDKGGYLGITFRDVNDDEVSPMHLKDGHGAEIMMVDHDGPAGKAGLREHDVVLSMNGVVVESEDQLRRMLHELPPGRSVSLIVCHDGTERTVNATLANRVEVEKAAWGNHWSVPQPAGSSPDDALFSAPPEPAATPKTGFGHSFMSGHLLPVLPTYTGATVDVMGSQLADYFGVKDGKGLLVHEVEGNSPASDAGLRAGDVVTKMNGTRVASKSDWNRALHDGKGHPVSVTVMRDRKEQTLTMVPDAKKRSAVDEPAHGLPVMMLR